MTLTEATAPQAVHRSSHTGTSKPTMNPPMQADLSNHRAYCSLVFMYSRPGPRDASIVTATRWPGSLLGYATSSCSVRLFRRPCLCQCSAPRLHKAEHAVNSEANSEH
jgi:hypothetical protein